jgi:hypothetical protein
VGRAEVASVAGWMRVKRACYTAQSTGLTTIAWWMFRWASDLVKKKPREGGAI